MLRQGVVSLLFKRPQSLKMKKHIIWEHSLVKKYSSSNHFKLINQLRKEVQKYPLTKKKDIDSQYNVNYKLDNKNNITDTTLSQNKNTNSINDNKSTVSFNNSKNFSIYKNLNTENKQEKVKSEIYDPNHSDEVVSTSTFKDRLKQIDLK